jgi:hypothetical protein
VEHRLHHVALPFPQLALARHDAVAEQDLDPVEPRTLRVVLVVRDQYALHVVGMIDDPHLGAARGREEAVDVPVAGEQLRHAVDRVVIGTDVELHVRQRGQARGLGGCGHGAA